MPSSVFIDTAGWASPFLSSEPFHQQATLWFQQARGQNIQFVTTNYILLELVALFTSPLRVPRPKLFQYTDAIINAPYVTQLYVDITLEGEAWTLLKNRPDKSWSLVDAASFVVMQRLDITEALTTDHHYEQAGFVRLLK